MESIGLPYFLQSLDTLKAHFEEHFEALTSQERGRQFLDLAQKVIPLTEEGTKFPSPEPASKETHDEGVDLLTAQNDAGETLRGQSKYKIVAVEDFDHIISKFRNYEYGSRGKDLPLLPPDGETPSSNVFFVVTSSNLDGIAKRYRASALASREFYERLQSEGRLVVVDAKSPGKASKSGRARPGGSGTARSIGRCSRSSSGPSPPRARSSWSRKSRPTRFGRI